MVTKKDTGATPESVPESSPMACGTCFSLTNILLMIVIVLNALGLYFLTGNSLSVPSMTIDPLGIKSAILEVEYDKAGGKANYDLLTRAQQLSLTDPQNQGNLAAMKQYVDSFGANGQRTESPSNESGDLGNNGTPLSLTGEDLQNVLKTAAIQGNVDASVIVIEYSDMECPFCVKQYHDTKLWPKLQEKYGDKVKFAFKNNRGVNHPGTEAKAIGALCAKKIAGDAAYIKFYTTVMDGTIGQNIYDVGKLSDAAKIAGVDVVQWLECTKNQETMAAFEAETKEAQMFDLSGTPGTLILNVKTGKYTTVTGAYPLLKFTQKIDALLAE